MKGFVGPKQSADSLHKKRTRKSEHKGSAELEYHPVAEHTVCALYITLADTDGVNGHAADADEHIHRAHCHNDRADQVDCPQRVCPHAPAYKNSVNDGEQKEADIAEYCGKNVPDYIPNLCVIHVPYLHSALSADTGRSRRIPISWEPCTKAHFFFSYEPF